jgi:hypothetical protein
MEVQLSEAAEAPPIRHPPEEVFNIFVLRRGIDQLLTLTIKACSFPSPHPFSLCSPNE